MEQLYVSIKLIHKATIVWIRIFWFFKVYFKIAIYRAYIHIMLQKEKETALNSQTFDLVPEVHLTNSGSLEVYSLFAS